MKKTILSLVLLGLGISSYSFAEESTEVVENSTVAENTAPVAENIAPVAENIAPVKSKKMYVGIAFGPFSKSDIDYKVSPADYPTWDPNVTNLTLVGSSNETKNNTRNLFFGFQIKDFLAVEVSYGKLGTYSEEIIYSETYDFDPLINEEILYYTFNTEFEAKGLTLDLKPSYNLKNDKTSIYAKIGYTFGNINYDSLYTYDWQEDGISTPHCDQGYSYDCSFTSNFDDSLRSGGLRYGLGIEQKITDSFALSVEYIKSNMNYRGDIYYDTSYIEDDLLNTVTDMSMSTTSLNLRIAYKF